MTETIAGYYISFDAPSALQTTLALKQSIWRKNNPAWHICGIPKILYTDHGSDFTSHHSWQVCLDLSDYNFSPLQLSVQRSPSL